MKETTSYQLWRHDDPIFRGINELIDFGKTRGRRLLLAAGIGELAFRDSEGKSLSTCSASDMERLLAGCPTPTSWRLMCNLPAADESDFSGSLTIFIDVEPFGVLVTVNSADVDLLTATIRQIERSFGFQQLPTGTKTIRNSPHATAMVGCHFDSEGKAAGLRLQQFLSLIGFARVDIADNFIATPIPEKIRGFLDKNDFYIGIVTGNRDHAWISSELSYAIAKSKEVVLIQGPGVTFDSTFYGGDREHLRYEHSIDETFIPLLQHIRTRSVVGF